MRQGRLAGPVMGTAPGVHQDGSTAQCGAGRSHVSVPEMAADIVDDLGSGFDGEPCCGGVEGIDGQDGLRTLLQDGFDNGENAGLFLFDGEGNGVGAGGFSAYVEDMSALVEHAQGVSQSAVGGVLRGVEVATIGEGVRRDVEDAHEDGAIAQAQGASAEAPVEEWSRHEGHGWILVFAMTGDMGRSARLRGW